MKILVILAHPDKESFNHAIAQAVVDQLELSGHKVFFHDLYEEKFDPLLLADEIPTDAKVPPEIDTHCWELALAEGIVIVHPNWWGQPPAILKGWIDRVMRPEVAYRFLEGDGGEGVPVGLLKAQTAVVFNTSNTPEQRENEAFGDPLDVLWRDCIFGFCGVEFFHRKMFRVIVTSSAHERQAWLAQVRQIIKENFNY